MRYFAVLRERAGVEAEVLSWDGPAPDVGFLREHLADRTPALGGLLRSASLLVAVNREYAAPGTPLRDGDEIAFLPPVTGG